jgi:hypothetical protein
MQPRLRVLRDGVAIGLIAYAAVALFYFVFDQLAARGSLHTVNLLGRAVFRGLRDPAVLLLPVQLDVGAIGLYNTLHLVLSLGVGVTVVALATRAERWPAQAAAMVAVMATGFVFTILAVGWLSAPMRPLLPWWSIVFANTLSVLLAGWYLVRRHPQLVPLFVPGAALEARAD